MPNVELSILNEAPPAGAKIRRSTRGKARAAVLILLNLLIVAHILQWWKFGRTVSPVEPSEAMFTLRDGFINAGFIFLVLATLLTLIFGRFICGWGCHIVALQDLCGWIMRKMGIRPKPFRSRLLMWVPAIAALYMFGWPIFRRVYLSWTTSQPLLPGFSNHVMTENFWATFPPVAVAIPFLLICGFATVYFLGSKGFCTYGCPYGAIFGAADRLATGRIVVNESCTESGHCTVACTSNVRVHAEVRDYGMVVDPGCMKCMDCVSVCPNHALAFKFIAPKLGRPARVDQPEPRRYDLTWGEEIALALTFAAAFFAFRGIYGVVPFLMALGVAGVFTFLVWTAYRMLRRPSVSVQRMQLKTGGQVTGIGVAFIFLAVACLGLFGHSLVYRTRAFLGDRAFAKTPPESDVLASSDPSSLVSGPMVPIVKNGVAHYRFCDRWGLLDHPRIKTRLAWFELLHGDTARSAALLVEAMRLMPDPSGLYDHLDLLCSRLFNAGNIEHAIEGWRALLEMAPDRATTWFSLGNALADRGNLDEAMNAWRRAIDLQPDIAGALHNLAGAYRQQGKLDRAIDHYERALSASPEDAETHFFLAVTLTQAGRAEEGLTHFQRAADLDPDNAEFQWQLGLSLLDAGRQQEAARHITKAIELEPRYAERLSK